MMHAQYSYNAIQEPQQWNQQKQSQLEAYTNRSVYPDGSYNVRTCTRSVDLEGKTYRAPVDGWLALDNTSGLYGYNV